MANAFSLLTGHERSEITRITRTPEKGRKGGHQAAPNLLLLGLIAGGVLVLVGGGIGLWFLLQKPASSAVTLKDDKKDSGKSDDKKDSGKIDAGKEEAVKKELQALEGAWELVSFVRASGDETPPKNRKAGLTIKGNSWAKEFDGNVIEKFTFQIDPTRTPKTIDLSPDRADRGVAYLSIYELNGDELRLCEGSVQQRPADFTPRNLDAMYTYKRVEP